MKARKKPRQKTGPKPKPEALLRRHAIMVRFQDAELAAVRMNAHAAGFNTVAAHIRARALAS